jgi:hypothetical protein
MILAMLDLYLTYGIILIKMHRIFTLLCLLTIVLSLDNGLAKTPPLIYSTFDRGCNFNEDYIRAQVNLLISTGLAVRGYRTVILDDCWQVRNDQCSLIATNQQNS